MDRNLKWFNKNKDFLIVAHIEQKLKIPANTVKHWISGRRELPEKWQSVLIEWVKEFKK